MKGSSKDLEAEFRSELSDAPKSSVSDQKTVLAKSESLSELLARIEEKLGHKKTAVKEELSSLKKMKDTIEKDITEIKDLEASEDKIKSEIEKIDSIRREVETIEEELNDKV
jgi:CRISPR/Cas system CMR-associated protein Cmr5 small subunit